MQRRGGVLLEGESGVAALRGALGEAALLRGVDDPALRRTRARLYLKKGEYDRALADLERWLGGTSRAAAE